MIGGIIGCALAVAAFILRMAASIGKQGRKVSWDDATMAVVLALAIPPTVFAHYRKKTCPVMTIDISLLTPMQ